MTLDARALAVKALREKQIEAMHERETKQFAAHGAYFLPYQIAEQCGIASIKKHWGAPDSGAGLEKWSTFIGDQVRQFLRRTKPAMSEGTLEALHVFDWTLFHDNQVEFRYDMVGNQLVVEEAF